MWGANLFILGRTILISPAPPPPLVLTQVFQTRSWKAGQVLSSPRLSVAKYWFEYMAPWNQPATDLCLSKAVRVGWVIGQIWPKYGAGRWSIHFHAATATRCTRKKSLFNQALPLLWKGEQASSYSLIERKWNIGWEADVDEIFLCCISPPPAWMLHHSTHFKHGILFDIKIITNCCPLKDFVSLFPKEILLTFNFHTCPDGGWWCQFKLMWSRLI